VVQGGDWGAWVTTRLAQQHPTGLLGIHLNLPLVIPDAVPATGLSPDDQRAADSAHRFRTEHFGYFEEQATRPQTIGYALGDSPAGLLAWIYEQFHLHTDPSSSLMLDQILDDITLYWLAKSSRVFGADLFRKCQSRRQWGVVELPVGCSIVPHEIYQEPHSWAAACYPQLIYWHELDLGGHFAALEQPVRFAEELRACIRSLRSETLSSGAMPE
jgi:epoxide hydrolase